MSDATGKSATTPDAGSLGRYLDRVVPGGVDGDLSVRLLSGGRSNPTYEVADASRAWILRRPPFGHVLPPPTT